MRRQHVPQLIKEVDELISTSDLVELPHARSFSDDFAYFWPHIVDDKIMSRISSAAIRLYLWLLVKQEEAARHNQWGLELTDTEIARELGISIRTAGTYRQELQKMGLLVIRGGLWTAKIRGDFQLQPR